MKNLADNLKIWFLTGSQNLYGPKTLAQVAENSGKIVEGFNASGRLPLQTVFKPVLKTPDEIRNTLTAANGDPTCGGIILWMHTFSPAKMWIGGLAGFRKPMLHLHTQFNRDLPWATIDMDFMNLNQSAHGDREHGFIHSRLRLERKVVVGHWRDREVHDRIAAWERAVRGWTDLQGATFVRFGDNMRQVAVTEGDKVAAEIRLGYSVNTHAVGDLAAVINAVSTREVASQCAEYDAAYSVAPALRKGGAKRGRLEDGARIEIGLRTFLEKGGFKGFTTCFEDLHGLKQLPGLAVQRLMAEGYGFGAEGDWKICALLRGMKAMSAGLDGGTSWMEDYTYHLDPEQPLVLGAHMLEICPSIAAAKPSLQIHPLGIGGKEDPVRLVFSAKAGPGLNATLVDMGNRFRLIVNDVDVVKPPRPMPKLPVAHAVWKCRPDFKTACAAWIHAGGAHHSVFSNALTMEHLEDFAAITGIEALHIGDGTTITALKNELRWNDIAYHLLQGVGR